MIPILFEPTATVFTTNGVGRLSDVISCLAHEGLNGEMEISLEYPVDGAHAAEIVHSAIIVANPSGRRYAQAYRVYQITKPMNGRYTILARHMTEQLSYIPVIPYTAANLTNALAYFRTMAAEACPFTISADFTSDADFAVPVPSSIKSCMGGRAGSILDIYGGEWEYDNYTVTLKSRRGRDSGYVIQYGKNLTTLTQEENIAETYTGVFPYWGSEGTTVTLTEKVIHASTAANFPYQRTLVKDFSNEFDGMPSEAELRAYTNAYIAANGIGVPNVNLTIDFVNLPDTEEYKDLLPGTENLDLGDTVKVYFTKLGISTESRVVEIWWDVLNERYQKISVGNQKSSLSATIEQQIQATNAAMTESQVAQKIDRATGVLNAGTRGHVILNRNASGWSNELLALNNDNIAAATRVLRINMNGIGFANSYSGPYYQAWTMDGTLSLGGVNNAYGNLVIRDSEGNIIGTWSNGGISIESGSINIGDKFVVDENGNLTATDGTFKGNITTGSTITGAKILGSEIGTTDDEFYVISNDEDDVEIGFSGFWVEASVMHSNWIGDVENPASGDDTAAWNGRTGVAGFKKLYLLDDWYDGNDGFWDVTRTIRWLDNRLRNIENFCQSHDWDGEEGGDDSDDPGSSGDDDFDAEGDVENDL